jgi:hypothetical protein
MGMSVWIFYKDSDLGQLKISKENETGREGENKI